MNVLAFVPYLVDTVPGQRFRIEQWAKALATQGVHFHFVPFESEAFRRVVHLERHHLKKVMELARGTVRRIRHLAALRDGWDVLFLHRELLPVGPPFLERILAAKEIPVVYDFDDAIFLPDTSDANRWFHWLKQPKKTSAICRLSDHTIVGNRYLQEYALRYTSSVSVIPTTIDTDAYTPKESAQIDGLPVIGWSGSLTTLKHLKTIGQILQELRKQLPFRLKVIGSERFSLPGVEVIPQAWNPRTEVEDLKSIDIGLMPLPDDPWARGKCGLKILQYMAVGVPTVASPVGVNAQIIEDGKNGFLASRPEEWVEKLMNLASDEALRQRFALEGRRTVVERYSAKQYAPRLLEILQAVSGKAGN